MPVGRWEDKGGCISWKNAGACRVDKRGISDSGIIS